MRFRVCYSAISMLVMVGALSSGRYCRQLRRRHRARAMHADSTVTRYRTVKVDGIDLFYREAGPADGPAVSFCTGFRPRRRCSAT